MGSAAEPRCQTGVMGDPKPHHWSVAGGLIQGEGGLLLVANRRRDGNLEWTPPGGVVDRGETSIMALGREVTEETGLIVKSWSSLVYEVSVEFPDRKMLLRVQVFRAESWSGSLVFDDPESIVEDGRFVDDHEGLRLLETAPRWVSEPVGAWIQNDLIGGDRFDYVAHGMDHHSLVVEQR